MIWALLVGFYFGAGAVTASLVVAYGRQVVRASWPRCLWMSATEFAMWPLFVLPKWRGQRDE